MIKVRVIPQLLIADGMLKKPVQFKRARTVANPLSIARVFESRRVDELILLDIGCAAHRTNVNPEIVSQIADELTVPLAVGGGVADLETISRLIAAGAEKIVINSAAVETPELITAGAGNTARNASSSRSMPGATTTTTTRSTPATEAVPPVSTRWPGQNRRKSAGPAS